MTYFTNYKKSIHNSIQMTPTEASLVKNSKAVYNSQFLKEISQKEPSKILKVLETDPST